MSDRDATNVLVAFLLGAVAGGMTALLLAPESGPDTRKRISDSLRKAKEKAKEEIDVVKEFAETHKDAIKEAYAEGKQAYQKTAKKTAD
jgi:gas vesicle protein